MILEVSNLKKSFGALRAVDGVSFSLEEGDNLAIVGESGCGKSTLAKLMMGLLKADEGQILSHRRKMSMVFQDPYSSLDPLWSLRSSLLEALLKQKLSPQEKHSKILKVLESVGLTLKMIDRFPHEFSGGQRQRMAIARALLTEPKILILDEAVSSLDILVQKQIMDLLVQLKKEFNLTYIFISHNLKIVKNFSDRIAVMRDGKIIETGSAKDIFAKPKELYTQTLIKAAFEYHI